ncbi:MAG: ATP synthase F0 subunit B [Bryobacteraceae bacterium]|nr:ATP synthase F0 subunit B [Bryobacteraceae bacterium]
MRRLGLAFAFLAGSLLAQEHAPEPAKPHGSATASDHGGTAAEKHATNEGEHASGETHGDPMLPWKWANFAILAGGLGYLLSKNMKGYFGARTAEIQKGIKDASAMKADADQRAAAIEAKLAGLKHDIEEMRREARHELENEGRRLEEETKQILAKVRQQTEQDIASASKAARQELKEYAASLAVNLAEQKLASQMTPETQRGLVTGFLRNLDGAKN